MDKFKLIPLEGFENLYKISKTGIVINTITNKEITQKLSNGYKQVHLYNRVTKATKTASVSRLLGITFIDDKPQDPKLIVNHINGNKIDNIHSNLEWITQKENIQHAIENNLIKFHTTSILKYDVKGNFIRKYVSIKEAALEHGVTRHAIIRVLKHKNKTASGFVWKYEDEPDEVDLSEYFKIPNYPYKVSKSGNVYSDVSKKVLKPITNESGYQYVTLTNREHKRNHYVHVLVASVFLHKASEDLEVNHKNKNRSDNRLENLEWITHPNNMLHAYSTKIN